MADEAEFESPGTCRGRVDDEGIWRSRTYELVSPVSFEGIWPVVSPSSHIVSASLLTLYSVPRRHDELR